MKTKELEFCFKTEWDYLGHEDIPWPNELGDLQKDWNMTLLTKINQCTANVFKSSHRSGADTIMIHPSLLPIIESIEYYEPESKKIAGRYRVVTINDLGEDDIIVLRSLQKEVFVDDITGEARYFLKTESENENELTVKVHDRHVEDEATYQELLKNSRAHIKILNYDGKD